MTARIVYLLCALASVGCGALLLRGYAKGRSRLLLWSGACFALLALNNVLLYADLVVFPSVDLSLWRAATGFAGLVLLVFGLVWDSQ
jgi:hypothetical protein